MSGLTGSMDMSWLIMVLLLITGMFIVILAAAGIAVYLVIRRIWQKNRMEDYPLLLLRERLAKGEIGLDEYAERRKWLKRY